MLEVSLPGANESSLTEALTNAVGLGLARLDAQRLLLHTLDRPAAQRAWLHAHGSDLMDSVRRQRFDELCDRRLAGVPLAYLVGTREFYGLTLAVDGRVLDPRPDTETLVDWALAMCKTHRAPQVLDLGCGSGAIALAIKHNRPDASVLATDASVAALEVARANAAALALDVTFAEHDWFAGIGGTFDLIVSNPPYIAIGDSHLAALAAEPIAALVSGNDGLDAIRQIVADARSRLLPDGWLLLEHGYDQAEAVRALLVQAGFAEVQSRPDLAGIERCSGGYHRMGA